jgi:hypothetical protein
MSTSYNKKSVYLLLLFLLPLFSFSQKVEEKPKYAPGKEKHKNKKDELGRRQGTWVTYNRYGEKISETDWVNDKKEGMEKKYYAYNKVKEEQEYLGGIKEGQYTKYFFSGQTASEGQYASGHREGKWTRYFEDGSVRQEGFYKGGKRDAVWKTYNRKGAVVNQSTYTEGSDLQQMELQKKKDADKKAADDAKKNASKTQNNKPLYPSGASDADNKSATPSDTTNKK